MSHRTANTARDDGVNAGDGCRRDAPKNTGNAQCLRVLQIPVMGNGIQTVDKNDFLTVTHKGNTLQAIT